MRNTLVILVCLATHIQLNAKKIDSLLNELEQTILKSKSFEQIRETRIKDIKTRSVKQKISNENKYYLYTQLIEEYEPFNFDSTQHYIRLNLSLAKLIGNKKFLNQSNINMSKILASSGRYFQAFEYLNRITKEELTSKLKVDYYEVLIKIYTDMGIYSPIADNKDKYYSTAHSYSDSLMPLLNKNSEEYLSILEKEFRDKRLLIQCLEINNKRLSNAKSGDRLYSQITFERSLIYELRDSTEMRIKYLILSAISDIKAAVKDNASLSMLAQLLHKQGEIDRAYKYIKFAYDDAVFYNSRLRYTTISGILPVINDAYQLRTNKQQKKLRNLLYIISILSFFLIIAIIFIYKQLGSIKNVKDKLIEANDKLIYLNSSLKETNTELNKLNSELSEANHVKEHYIANFLSICSNYIDKLDSLNKSVGKKIAAGKTDELFKESKSRKLIDEELKEFYQNFDYIFLHLYPNFVEKINLLLKDDEQIVLKSNEYLNTELRVFALIRLGINDSSRIARLLRYSVNTIYNYRAKVKNKAKGNRAKFEDGIMEIDAVQL